MSRATATSPPGREPAAWTHLHLNGEAPGGRHRLAEPDKLGVDLDFDLLRLGVRVSGLV